MGERDVAMSPESPETDTRDRRQLAGNAEGEWLQWSIPNIDDGFRATRPPT
jgi:hypothetical protein